MGVTPIKEYLQAIVDTGYEGTVSIELEYSPEPDKIVPWAQEAYDGTAQIMSRARRPLRAGLQPWTSACRARSRSSPGPPKAASATAMATRLLDEGCRVVAVDRNAERNCAPSSTQARRGDGAPRLRPLDGRLRRPLVGQRAQERFGGVDVLVNNAGIYPSHAWDEYSVEEWDATLDTNLRAMWLAGEGGGPADGAGAAAARSSTSARSPRSSGWRTSSRTSRRKGGVIGLTRAWRARSGRTTCGSTPSRPARSRPAASASTPTPRATAASCSTSRA